MKMVFDLDKEKCVACGACAVACMDQNDIFPENGDVPYRSIAVLEPEGEQGFRYLSLACMHCGDAPCIAACPMGCLSKNELGLTVMDNGCCIGCRACLRACPYGAPKFGTGGKMSKCDGCAVRQRYGYEPACVRICPNGALLCVSEEGYGAKKPERSLREDK